MTSHVLRAAALLSLIAVLVPSSAIAQRPQRRTAPALITVATNDAHPATTPRPRSTAATTSAAVTTNAANTPGRTSGRHRIAAPRPCVGPIVSIVRESGGGHWTGALTDCHNRPTVRGLAALSLLAAAREVSGEPDLAPLMHSIRHLAPAAGWDLADDPGFHPAASVCPLGQEPVPGAHPTASTPAVATASTHRRSANPTRASGVVCRAIAVARDPHTHDALLVIDGRVRVLHPRLLQMLTRVSEHFPGRRVEIISGYRPSRNPRAGSRHAHARALDFRIEGVHREALRDFAQTLPEAGVGYYPNSVFVHMDVRDSSEGSARWTDYSAPREHPRYGAWPPRSRDVRSEARHIAGQTRHTVDAVRAAMDDGAEASVAPAAESPPDAPAAPPAPPPPSNAAAP